MIRFRHLAVAAGAAVLAAGSIAGPAQAQKYEFKMTSYVSAKGGFWNSYQQKFIDAVELFTNGEVKIKGFSIGVIAGAFDGLKAVQKGTADISYNYPGYNVNEDPTNGVFGNLPGGMPMEQFMHWYIAGDGTKLLEEFRQKTQQLHPVLTGMGSSEFLLHSHKPVRNIADLKGMKIRTAGPWADILKSLGASSTVIPGPEIYTALERRVVDATEFVTPATNIKLGFHKIAKYVIMPGLHSPSHMNEAVFKLETWNKLPKRIRDLISAAGQLSAFQTAMSMGAQDFDAMEKLMAGKNEFITLDAASQAKIEELGRAWCAEQAKAQKAKGNDWMERVSGNYWAFYDRYKKFGVYRHN